MGFDKAREAYAHKLKTSKPFRKLIETIEVTATANSIDARSIINLQSCTQSHSFCHGNEAPSFMILPVQRVPRYKLLLQGEYALLYGR